MDPDGGHAHDAWPDHHHVAVLCNKVAEKLMEGLEPPSGDEETTQSLLQQVLVSLNDKIMKQETAYMNEYNKANRVQMLQEMRRNIKAQLGMDETDGKASLQKVVGKDVELNEKTERTKGTAIIYASRKGHTGKGFCHLALLVGEWPCFLLKSSPSSGQCQQPLRSVMRGIHFARTFQALCTSPVERKSSRCDQNTMLRSGICGQAFYLLLSKGSILRPRRRGQHKSLAGKRARQARANDFKGQ